jgi:8-oxo-dGTP pyrophosphatase MutT (NUDIX family)
MKWCEVLEPGRSMRIQELLEHRDLPLIIGEILKLRVFRPIGNLGARYRHAAVLIPLFLDKGELKVLLTQRTHRVETHKGQISFPGGRVDEEDDSFQETALREAHEEIGLLREDVTILGRLDDATTLSSHHLVHPFVGLIPYPYPFIINPEEVKRLVQVPLEVFAIGSAQHRTEDIVEYQGKTYRTPTFVYEGDVIWGATARIMENFANILEEKLRLLCRGA